jgi:hypothetical protein
MNDIAGWVAPIATMIAAMMTAANLGARFTGWGFIVFFVGSVAWSTVAIATGQQNLLWTNAFLTLVNAVGIWRWLGRQARYEDGGKDAAARSSARAVPTIFPIGGIIGSKLVGKDGEAVATVVESMMRCEDLGIAYIVVSDGGIGGIAEQLYAIDASEVELTEQGFVCALSPDDLKRRTPIEPDKWPVSCRGGPAPKS